MSIFPIAELAKDAEVPLPEPTDAFHGITLAINVDKPDNVNTALKSVEKLVHAFSAVPAMRSGVGVSPILLTRKTTSGRLSLLSASAGYGKAAWTNP